MHILQVLSSNHIDPLESGFHSSLHCFALAGAGRFFVTQMASTNVMCASKIYPREGRKGVLMSRSLKSLKMLDGLRTCTRNACLLSYSAVVFGIGLQLTSVKLVIWFHLQNVECTSLHSPSSFPQFLLGCLRKLVSRYPAVATVQEAQIMQGNQVPKSRPVWSWRSSLSDAAVWIALCRSVVFQVIGIGSSTSKVKPFDDSEHLTSCDLLNFGGLPLHCCPCPGNQIIDTPHGVILVSECLWQQVYLKLIWTNFLLYTKYIIVCIKRWARLCL